MGFIIGDCYLNSKDILDMLLGLVLKIQDFQTHQRYNIVSFSPKKRNA